MPEPVKPPTTQEAVLSALRRALAAGDLRPGEQLRQEQLAHRWGVSRVPLREAMRTLESEGRIEHLPHRGYFVARLSAPDLREVYRLRELLEAEAIEHAVPRLDPERLALLRESADAVTRASATGDLAAVSETNRRFHFLLFDAAGRPLLLRLLGQLWDATDAYRTVYFTEPANRVMVDDEHNALLAAIDAGDTAAAIGVQAAHREHSLRAVVAVLEATDLAHDPAAPVV